MGDDDGDGFSIGEGDCNDYDGWVNPGVDESCDGIDNNCDGLVDEGCQGFTPPETTAPETSSCSAVPVPTVFGWLAGLLVLARRRQ